MPKLCALVIGHMKESPGAKNKSQNLTEFDFNDDLAPRIKEQVNDCDVQIVYRKVYDQLPGQINTLNPDFIVSLHCNSYHEIVSGTEVLYYHTSQKGQEIAKILQGYLVDFLQLPNRGVRPKTAEDRGGFVLAYTHAPCIIAEPFFIHNDADLARAQKNLDGLAGAYAKAFDEISQVV